MHMTETKVEILLRYVTVSDVRHKKSNQKSS